MTLFQANQAIAIVAPTPAAVAIGRQLQSGLPNTTIWTKRKLPFGRHMDSVNCDNPDSASSGISGNNPTVIQQYDCSLACLFEQLWPSVDALVCILATGAIIRLIAPLLTDKRTDPAVLAIDEKGQFAISLCGGHVAGGNDLTTVVSTLLSAIPVVSSGSEAYQLPAIDTLGEPLGWRRGSGDWTGIASSIVRAAGSELQSISVVQTCGWDIWRDRLPEWHPFCFEPSFRSQQQSAAATVWISDCQPPAELASPYICWHPRTLWIGVGCERGTSAAIIESAIRACLQEHGLAWEAIAGLTSINIKQDEAGLLTVASTFNWPIIWHGVDPLRKVAVPNPSAVVERAVGTPSVAEASALLAAAATNLVVEKQTRRSDGAGACTIAIARSEQEYSDRSGALYLVGIGPGSLDLIAPAARTAIAKADVVVGYQLYVDLIAPLLSQRHIVRSSPITQEIQRAHTAIELANRGLSVAVISSGDCGIYGMAGLVMEQLAKSGWDGMTPSVEVLPGITALQAAAARVGTPLMHDFCAISLSDLLTPWETIEQRLEAAATADFVVALYNPRSRTRTQGLTTARDIFCRHRSSDTPVAIVKSAYRPTETTAVTTLEQFDVTQVDMLSTVLIGNSKTFIHANHPITPRGYCTS